MTQTFRIQVVVDPKGVTRGVRQTTNELGRVEKKAGSVGKALRRAFLFLGGAAALGSSIRLLAQFSQEMSTVRAITQATGDEFAMLSEEAKRLGATTRFSASEAAQGMVSLARAGFDANEVLRATEATLQLAQAGMLDLGQAADIATNILTGFGLEVKEINRVVDVLALGANSANTDVRGFGEAMKFIAPIAAGLSVPLEDAAVAVQALANAGLKGGLGGRGARGLLAELQPPSEKLGDFLEHAGLAADQFTISSVGLYGALDALAAAGVNAKNVFGLLENSAATAFLAMRQQSSELGRMRERLDDAGGAAERIAKMMDDNLNGSLFALRSALQGLNQELGDSGATGTFRAFFNTLTLGLRAATKDITSFIHGIEGLAFAIGTTLAGKAIPKAIGALRALKVALLTNPVTFLAGALGLVATAFAAAGGAVIAFRDEIVLSQATGVTLGDVMAATFEVMRDRMVFAVRVMSLSWPLMKDAVIRAVTGMAEAIEGFLNGLGISFSGVLGQIGDIFKGTFNNMLRVHSGFWHLAAAGFDRLRKVATIAFELIERGWDSSMQFLDDVAYEKIQNTVTGLGALSKFAADVFGTTAKAVEDLGVRSDAILAGDYDSASVGELTDELLRLTSVADLTAESVDILKGEFERDFFKEFVDGGVAAFEELAGAFKDHLKNLGFGDAEIEKQFGNLFDLIAEKAAERSKQRAAEVAKEIADAIAAQPGGFIGPVDFEKLGRASNAKDAGEFIGPPNLPPEAVSQLAAGGGGTAQRETELVTLGKVFEGLEEESRLLRMNAEDRRIAIDVLGIENDMRQSAIDLGKEFSGLNVYEQYALETKLKSLNALEREAAILERVNGEKREHAKEVATLTRLYNEGEIALTDYTRALSSLGEQAPIAGGFALGFERVNEILNQTASLAAGTVVNAFGRAEDALVQFVTTGKASLSNLVDGILSDFSRLTVRLATNSLFDSISGSFGKDGDGSLLGFFGSLVGREKGGPVDAGQSYLVGEKGPEIITPKNAGVVTPAGRTAAILESSRGGGGQSVVNVPPAQPMINNYIVNDPAEIPNAMESPSGVQAFFNILSKNKSTARGVLGV